MVFHVSVVESHPDNAVDDLRLLHAFPTLINHIDSYGDLASMPAKKLCHVPYPVIIYKYLAEYRKCRTDGSCSGTLPTTRAEKVDFQKMLRNGKSEAAKRAAVEQAEQEKEHASENGHAGDEIEMDIPGNSV